MFIFVMSVAMNIIGYLMRIFLARSLAPADYGLIYAAISLLGLLNIFRNLGFSDTLRKKIPEYMVNKDYVKIKSSIVLSFIIEFVYMFIIFSIVFIFAGRLSEGLFESIRGVEVLVLLALSGLISVFNGIIQSAFQGLRKVRIYTSIDFLTYLLRFIFIIAFISFGVLALPYAYLLTAIIITATSFFIFRYKFPFITRAKTMLTRKFSKEILYFSTPLMIGYVASSVVLNVDTVLISTFRTLKEVALYQVAQPLANLLLLVASTVTVVLMPVISELWTKNRRETVKEMLGLLTKAVFILVIPLALIMIAFPENVIGMLFGETYLGASFALQLLSLSSIILTMYYILSSSIIGIGKPLLGTKIAFVIMAVNVVFNIILIPIIGITGAALSLIASILAGFSLITYFVKKYINVLIQWFNLLKIFVGGILTLLIIFAIKTILVTNPWIELVIALVAGFIFYAFFILLTKSITKSEIDVLTSVHLPIPKILVRLAIRILN